VGHKYPPRLSLAFYLLPDGYAYLVSVVSVSFKLLDLGGVA
jgi:hypothetical protein